MVWDSPECSGDVPSSRAGHSFTAALDNGVADDGEELVRKAILFAGNDFQLPAGPTNDLFEMNLDTFEWKKIEHSGPEPRSKHSATCIRPSTICVFGGLGAKSRLNDCWLLNTKTMQWSMAYGDDATDVPVPRGGHSACILDGKLWIMFGYGGKGYGRRDLGDIHTLDLETMKWSSVNPAGEWPVSRSSHQSVVVEKKIYVSGGWNSSDQLKDINILDTDTMSWSAVDEGFAFSTPRWNHSTVAVWAVPNWKIFVFGGNSGSLTEGSPQGEPLNDTIVIDTGDLQLWEPKCVGEIPEARSDSELLYDEDTHRLLLFGGWAGEWFGELQVLNVAEIVGPPYSVTELGPLFGPITGNATVQVHRPSTCPEFVGKSATVRFACEKGFVDADGQGDQLPPRSSACTPAFTQVRARARRGAHLRGRPCPTPTPPSRYKFHSVTCKHQYTLALRPRRPARRLPPERRPCLRHPGSATRPASPATRAATPYRVKVVCDSDQAQEPRRTPAVVTKVAPTWRSTTSENGTYTRLVHRPQGRRLQDPRRLPGHVRGRGRTLSAAPPSTPPSSNPAAPPESNTLDGPSGHGAHPAPRLQRHEGLLQQVPARPWQGERGG